MKYFTFSVLSWNLVHILHLENLSIQTTTFQVLNRHMKGGCCFGQNSCGVKHQFVEQLEDREVCYTQSKDAIIKDPECEKFFRTMIWFLSLEKVAKKKKAGGSKVWGSVTDFKWLMNYTNQMYCVDLVWILIWRKQLYKIMFSALAIFLILK